MTNTVKSKILTYLLNKSLFILSLRSSEIGMPKSGLSVHFTFDDVNEIVEADASVSLLGLLEGRLQLSLLVFIERAPIFPQNLIEISSTFSFHLSYICMNNLNLNAFILHSENNR